jgi:hypothetical protein
MPLEKLLEYLLRSTCEDDRSSLERAEQWRSRGVCTFPESPKKTNNKTISPHAYIHSCIVYFIYIYMIVSFKATQISKIGSPMKALKHAKDARYLYLR